MTVVSIGLPVFNGEDFLKNALESLVTQTYEDFELIISDNASTDNTEEICRNFKNMDKRIKYYRNEKNVGAAGNYNRVFKLSCGEYFKWASHDDLCEETFLERCVEKLNNDRSVVLCYPKARMIDENGNALYNYNDNLHLQDSISYQRLGRFLKNYDLCNPIFGLIRSSYLAKTHLIGKYIGSDYVLLLELCLLGKFWEIPEYLFMRRDHEKNVRRLSLIERAKWFDTSYNSKHHKYPLTTLFYKQLLAIKHSPIPQNEKIICFFQMSRWILNKARNLGGIYKAAIKKKLRFSF